MKRRLLTLFTSVCLVFLLWVPAAAAGEYTADTSFVYDNASLLSENELEYLETFATTAYASSGCGVYIITIDSFERLGSSTVYDCATELFISYKLGFGTDDDGVLLLLSMEDRDFAFISHGNFANNAFPDYIKAAIEDEFLDDFANDDWYEGFKDYFEECRSYLTDYIEGGYSKDYNNEDNYYISSPSYSDDIEVYNSVSGSTWLVIIGVPVLIAFIVCSIFKGQMKTAVKKTEARDYIVAKDIDIRIRQDMFTHRTETRRVIQNSSSSSVHRSSGGSRSGGGFSGRSGKF